MSCHVLVKIPPQATRAVKAIQSKDARLCLVGGSPALGQWDPKRSPQLNAGLDTAYSGKVDVTMEEFKFCIFNPTSHEYVWEEQGPLHRLPGAGQCLEAVFEDGSKDALTTRGYAVSDKAPAPAAPAAPVPEKVEVSSADSTGGGCRVSARSARGLEASQLPGAVCALVGELPQLGQWDPKKAWKFAKKKKEDEGGAVIWEGSFAAAKVPTGQQFKYCILHEASNTYVWEESGPMHSWPASEEIQDFEAGGSAAPSGGGGGHLGAWPPRARSPAPVAGKAKVLGAGCTDRWIKWPTAACCAPGVKAPRTIFHAFHWPFALVLERLPDIADLGFDAVQISPAQKSKHGHEWWARYQPQDYSKIEGLGSWEELKQLCTKARELKLRVIGDVVFNHMLVVGSCHEWRQAQKNPGKLKELQQRLVQQTPMQLEDFQWPWFEMSGDHWDNENRYEGWGSGEWSELRYCPRVVAQQQKHLQMLLDAGVSGVRFDAVKHLRPAHLEEHLQHLRKNCQDAFVYGEVLSLDESMHQEYMALQCPSTDFPLTVWMTRVLSEGVVAAEEGIEGACARAAKTSGLKASDSAPLRFPSTALSGDSVRFARNHDTVCNPNLYYGLGGGCGDCQVMWAWLLSLHDGTVLVFPEDMQHEASSSLLCRAVRFRQQMHQATASEICLRYTGGSSSPALLLVVLKNGEELLGMAAVNLCREAVEVSQLVPGARKTLSPASSESSVQPDGRLTAPLVLAARDAEFWAVSG